MKFHVWCPDYGGTPETARLIDAYTHTDAAVVFAQNEFNGDSFESITVHVRRGDIGEINEIEIQVRAEPVFEVVSVKVVP